MATANPALLVAHSSVPQQLYTITNTVAAWRTDDLGVPSYQTIGQYAGLTFDTTDKSIGGNIALVNPAVISLSGGITYEIIASTDLINHTTTTPVLTVFDVVSNQAVGQAVNINKKLVTYYAPSTDTAIVVSANLPTGEQWGYPSQLTNSQISVKAVDGWTE